MKDQLTEEKELLIMKGDALRMKLLAQSRHARQHIYQPVSQLKNLSGTLCLPIMRSMLIAAIENKFLTKRNLVYSILSLAGLYLLNKKTD